MPETGPTVDETMAKLGIGPATAEQMKNRVALATKEANKYGDEWRYKMLADALGGLSHMTDPEKIAKDMQAHHREALAPLWDAGLDHLLRFVKEAKR